MASLAPHSSDLPHQKLAIFDDLSSQFENSQNSDFEIPALPRELWTKILDHLNYYRDLNSFRRINSLFNEICLDLVYQGDLCEVNFCYNENLKSYINEDETSQINEFLLIRQNSPHFPTTSYYFENCFQLTSDPIQKFFINFGHSITYLKFQLDCKTFLQRPVYTKILSQVAATLKTLTLFDNTEDDERLDPTQEIIHPLTIPEVNGLLLPCLENFSFQLFEDMSCIKEILGASPNLKVVTCAQWQWPEINFAEFLLEVGHLDKLMSFSFYPQEEFPCDLDLFERVVNGLNKLKKIKFNLFYIEGSLGRSRWSKCARIISKLLKLNQETIQEINLDTPMGFLGQVDWPILSQLKKFVISLPRTVSYKWFQQQNYSFLGDLNWTVTFPNLNRINFLFQHKSNLLWSPQLFPLSGWAGNIKKLHLHGISDGAKFEDTWFQQCNKFFTNLENLTLGIETLHDFTLFGKKLWNLKSLKVISISLYSCFNLPISYDFCMDWIVTGFSPQTCHVLRNVDLAQFKSEEVRQDPSILDLKDLRHFNIELLYPCENLKLMSHLSAIYGFNLMSNLNVTVTIMSQDMKETGKTWDSIRPYINIKFNDDC